MENQSQVETNMLPLWRHPRIRLAVATCFAIGLIASAPTIVLGTGLRDVVLNHQLAHIGLTGTSESGSGGWFSPLKLYRVSLKDDTGRARTSVQSVSTSATILELITENHKGDFSFVDPVVEIELDENGDLPPGLFAESGGDSRPTCEFEIDGGRFVLSVPGRNLPLVELDQLHVEGEIVLRDGGHWLDVQPIELFDHDPIDEAHTEQNLAMVAPVLTQSAKLAGDISVTLAESSLQLDAEEGPVLDLAGAAVFHSVEARLRKEWVAQVGQMLGKAMEADIPNRLEIIKDSKVSFTVDESGIWHKGLVFLLPDLAEDLKIDSSGVVGLDGQMDLAFGVTIPPPRNAGLFASIIASMAGKIQVAVKGTVDDPKLVMPAGTSLLKQFSGNLEPEKQDQEPGVAGSVLDLLGAAQSEDPKQKAAGITGGVLKLIRASRKKKRDRQGTE